jgi:L-lactate permease
MVKTIDTLFGLLEALVCIFMVVFVVAVCFLVALPFLPFLLITNMLKGNTREQKFKIAAIGILINCVYWYLTSAYLQAEFPDMVIPVVSSVTLLICLLAILAFPP